MALNYRRTTNVPRNKPVDNEVSFRYIPDDRKNIYASKFKDVAKNVNIEKPPFFSNDDANEFLSEKVNDSFDGQPYFKYDNDIAKDFLDKYRYSFIIPDEEKATPESIRDTVMGPPGVNIKNNMGYPGSEGAGGIA